LALEAGLSAAIMNPYSADMKKSYYAFRALRGLDKSCRDYIAAAAGFAAETAERKVAPTAELPEGETPLRHAILHGLREAAGLETEALLAVKEPLTIVEEEIIPAMVAVGEAYERGALYLPGLLISAEAAAVAFERIKARLAGEGGAAADRGPFVLATVRGDIHDIGKNIVRLILENYGYRVIDLGRDVPPEAVLDAVLTHRAPLCGLSALMTTTVPAMAETVALLKREAPFCRTVVGGAVLTAEYAATIGADLYAPDPMTAVRYADEVLPPT
ncbi:MAG: cobalamin-dependent protein, partial [Clostridia bacterium]|nr:cobalamin-dependent protein [Clostridia bacterium]